MPAALTRQSRTQPPAHPRQAPALGAGARELLLFAAAYLVYFGVRALTEGAVPEAVRNALRVQSLERAAAVDAERAVQDLILRRETLVDAANAVYMYGHWPVLIVGGILLFHLSRGEYYRLRTVCLVSGAIGLAVFALFPVAPPRLAPTGLVDTISAQASGYRQLLPTSLVNEYAAMPSFHAGWNLVLGIELFRASSRLLVRGFAVAMPSAMAFAVVATANHFVLDVLAGAVIVTLTLAAVRRWERRHDRTTLDPREHAVGPVRCSAPRRQRFRRAPARGAVAHPARRG